MVMPGLINLDFADVRSVMTEMGKAMMGTGEAGGEDRALNAAQNAIANPLLDEVSLKGAKAVLVNVTGGLDMTLLEVDEAANAISSEVDPDANIIFGAAFDPSLEGRIRVSVVATGMESGIAVQHEAPRSSLGRPAASPLIVPAAPTPRAAARTTATATGEPTLWPEPARPEAARAEPQRSEAARDTGPEDRASAKADPIIRIIDPAVEDETERYQAPAREPLTSSFGNSAYDPRRAAEVAPSTSGEARHKGGWLSLFGGRPRYDPTPLTGSTAPRSASTPSARPAAISTGSAQPAAPPAVEPHDATDDLEIPSFLRRLAN
jgi:cell division protein FtsZ